MNLDNLEWAIIRCEFYVIGGMELLGQGLNVHQFSAYSPRIIREVCKINQIFPKEIKYVPTLKS